MKLTSVRAINFKGPEFLYNLTPVSLLVGRNFRGKTRVIDAIIVGLLGYHPSLGKTAKATFSLSSGKDMEVHLYFDNGETIRRRFFLKGDTVRTEEQVPESFNQEGMAAMLDASLYFALTDRQRVEYVFANCQAPAGFDRLAIMARLNTLGALHTKLAYELHDDLGEAFELTAQAFVDRMIEAAASRWKASKDTAARMEKTIQGMSQLRAQDDAVTPLAVLDEAKAILARDISVLTEKRGRLAGSYAAMVEARRRREEIDNEVRRSTKASEELVLVKAKVAVLSADLARAPNVLHEELRLLWTEVSRCQSLVDQLTVAASTQLKAKERAERLLSALDQQTCCPYCGAAGSNWKATNAAELAKGIDEAAGLQADALAKRTVAQVDLDAAFAKHAAAVEAQKKHQALMTEHLAVSSMMVKLEGQLSRITALNEERARLMENNPQLTADVESLQTQLNIKNDEARKLDADIRIGQSRKSELQRLADAEKERDEAKAEQETAAEVGKELRVIQGEMVQAAFKPLLETANAFFAKVLKSPLAYNKAEGGEIGTWRDGLWVGHHTFSGTEKVLTYAAIQMALASKMPFRLMLLDELGRLDDVSALGALNAVCLAVDNGLIDGAVGIDVAIEGESGELDHRWLTSSWSQGVFRVIEIK